MLLKKHLHGFTLVESLVVVSITAILLTVGVPSMRSMAERNAISSQVNNFLGVLIFARSEAIKRGAEVVVCRSANAESSATPTCAASGAGWESGWIVFLDRNGDGQNGAAQGDVLLRVQGPVSNSGGVEQIAFKKLVFRSTGLLSSGASSFTFNSKSLDATQRRRVCLSFTGRARATNNPTEVCQ